MKFEHILFAFFWILCLPAIVSAQDEDEGDDLVQFSGIVVSVDSISPVSFTNIVIKNSWRGTVADYYGYFSFVAHKLDTIIFSAVGYKKSDFVIPDTITANRYSLIQVMSADTVLLPQTVIYPWPSPEEFKEAFLSYEVPDDDFERAKKNLEAVKLREMAESIPMGPDMNYNYSMQLKQDKLYYIGQTQPISILNPFAWAQFMKAWKEGKFKRRKK